jgi:hypothetical protein
MTVTLQPPPPTFALTENVVRVLSSIGTPTPKLYIEELVSTEQEIENEQWVFQQSPFITKNEYDVITGRKSYGYGSGDMKLYDIDARVSRATWYLIVHTFRQGVCVETLSWKGFKLQFAVVTDPETLSVLAREEVPLLHINKAQAFLAGTNHPGAKPQWVRAYPAISLHFSEDEDSFHYDQPLDVDLSNVRVLITLKHSQVDAAAYHYDYKPPFGPLYQRIEPKILEGKVEVTVNELELFEFRIGSVRVFLFYPHPKFDSLSAALRVMANFNIQAKVRVYETYYGRLLIDICGHDFP